MKRILVVLPAGKIFDQLFARAIKPVCEELGLEIFNPPIQLNNPPSLDQALRIARDADLVLADVSAGNASVLYAVGFSQALVKTILFSAIAAESFPLNAQHFQPIIHAGHPEVLAMELRGRLKLLLNDAGRNGVPATDASADPHATARHDFEAIFGEILRAHHHRHSGPVYKENDTTFVLENNDMEFALVQELARHAKSLNLRLKLL